MEMTPAKARGRVWSETRELTLPEARSLSFFGPAGEHRWHRLSALFQRVEIFNFHQSRPGCVQSPQSCAHDRVYKGLCTNSPEPTTAPVRKVSEAVLTTHLYSASFGHASAERKAEFVAEVGGRHSMSLNLLSQGSGLFCLCTILERREIKVMF